MQLKSIQYIARLPIQLLRGKMNDNKFMREGSYLVLCRSETLFVEVTACSRVLLSIIRILRGVSKIGECYSMGQRLKIKYLQPIGWKHLLCFEISVDVYAVCVFSGRVVNFQHKGTA